jgi:pimeloyl-ACP methyl ester carboxylesterase
MGYDEYHFIDPWKQVDTVLLQTGCMKARNLYYAWIPVLARHFRVIRVHLRGHYDSTPAPEGYRWTIEGLALDHKHFLDALGLDRVHYVGESLGGLLGYHFAYHYPERLKTLTVVNAPGPSFKHHRMAAQHRYLETMRREGIAGAANIHVTARIEEMGDNRNLVDWWYDAMVKSPLAGSIGYLEAAYAADVDAEEFLRKIRVPTLLLMGAEHTRILTVEEAQHFRDLMPRAELVAFPGVKGFCQVAVPQKCAEEVVRFIGEQEREKASK